LILHVAKSVPLRGLGDDGGGQDLGNVILGLLTDIVRLGDLPKITAARGINGPVDFAGAGVVGGEREIPVSELFIQILQMSGGGDRGLFRIPSLIQPIMRFQSIESTGGTDELPETRGGSKRIGMGVETTLDHGEEDDVLGKTVFSQDLKLEGNKTRG